MRQKNESRLFNQMLIMRGIEEEYQQLCKSEKSVSTERVVQIREVGQHRAC